MRGRDRRNFAINVALAAVVGLGGSLRSDVVGQFLLAVLLEVEAAVPGLVGVLPRCQAADYGLDISWGRGRRNMGGGHGPIPPKCWPSPSTGFGPITPAPLDRAR